MTQTVGKGSDDMHPYTRTRRSAIVGSVIAAAALVLTACTGRSNPAPSRSTPDATTGTGSFAATSPGVPSVTRSGGRTSGGAGVPSRSSSLPTALQTVPTIPVTTLPAKPLTSPAAFGTGVRVRIESITHGKVTDRGRGSFYGRPTVVFHFALSNNSSRTVDLDNVQVSATYGGQDTPAIPADDTTMPFTGSVRQGGTARGAYAFAVPKSGQARVEVTVAYRQGAPTVLLRGSAR